MLKDEKNFAKWKNVEGSHQEQSEEDIIREVAEEEGMTYEEVEEAWKSFKYEIKDLKGRSITKNNKIKNKNKRKQANQSRKNNRKRR